MTARILVVEDDPDSIRILRHILTGAGYEVIIAFGGEAAFKKLDCEQFDLILTDLSMPAITGVDVISAVKGDPNLSHIPVIAVTAHTWGQLAQSAGQVGCDGFISKPYTAAQLLEEVRRHLARQRKRAAQQEHAHPKPR